MNVIAVNDLSLTNIDKLKGQFQQNQIQTTLMLAVAWKIPPRKFHLLIKIVQKYLTFKCRL